ncbi:hypothetical protein [Micromonospora sp. NBC_01813]|uniref:hypothetical protein n=1 Tax=Micromonospora sp. NBC_01813 TaxID=2975988 RepID=UPI002DDC5165|nr:hypothetical protein [Micromonospora sp. NBC_01813]WSA11140.1 hypothetical protein OG958_10410 [Micromonospora sp. NBC_01813]
MRDVAIDLIRIGALVGGLLALTLIIGLAIGRSTWRGRGRPRQWARQQGWKYSWFAERWRPVARRLTWLGGHLGPAVSGTFDGWPVTAFRVRPRSSSVDTKHYVVVAVTVPVPLPELRLRPRTWAASLFGSLDGPEVRTGVPTFDDQYLLQAHDHAAVRALVRPPLTEQLSQVAPMPILMSGHWVITWTAARDMPAAIDQLLPTATLVAQQFTTAAERQS